MASIPVVATRPREDSSDDAVDFFTTGENMSNMGMPDLHTVTVDGPRKSSMRRTSEERIRKNSVQSEEKNGIRRFSMQSTDSAKGELPVFSALHVDWNHVLTSLQREKKRKTARQEEQYVHRSLFCLESSSMTREFFIKVAEWDWFNRLILILILANCVFLVLDDPVCKCQADTCTGFELYTRALYASLDCGYWDDRKAVLQYAEWAFTGMFTLEMIVKIVARGFFLHKHAYLRDGWNWLDFVVVVCSLISLAPGLLENVQVLRTVRVLRPLRTMTRIKGMRPLINTLLRSIKALGNVVMLLMFFLIVYGILALELLNAGMRGRCYVDPVEGVNNFTDAAYAMLISQQTPFLAAPTVNIGGFNAGIQFCSTSKGGGYQCPEIAIDGHYYSMVCSKFKWCFTDWCKNDWNPNPFDLGGGHISYDNIGDAFLSIFQTLTMEGWSDLLYNHMDGYNAWGARFFHSSWVLIGTFFVIQLALAVLSDSFVSAQRDEITEKEREALSANAILKPDDWQGGLKNLRSEKLRQRLAQVYVIGDVLSRFRTSSAGDGSTTSSYLKQTKMKGLVTVLEGWWRAVTTACRILVSSSLFQNVIILAILCNTAVMSVYHHNQDLYETSICQRKCDLDGRMPADASDHCIGPLFNRSFTFDGQGGGYRPQQEEFCFLENDAQIWPGNVTCSGITDYHECHSTTPTNGVACHWFGSMTGGSCKLGLYDSGSFVAENVQNEGRGGTLSLRHICGDTLGQCPNFNPTWNRNLSVMNTVLTMVFITEMVLKWLGLGLSGYFSDKFNQFDCFIVMASIVEIVVEAFNDGNSSGSGISALRGMRLFRLFKLARSWKSMRKILHTLAVALGSLGPLTLVWMMFMYIFALLAMQFFGGKFRFVKADTPRSNFDSFFPSNVGHGAFLVVFQIISVENWNTIMFNCMTALNVNTPFASLLPVAIVTFGNYIIMNLFISILLQGFGDDDEDEDEPTETVTKSTPAKRLAAKFRSLVGRTSTPGMASANRIGAMSGDDANELQSEPSQTQNAAMLLARRVVPNKAEILGEEYEESDADPNMATLHVQFRGVTHDVHVPDANSLVCLKTNNPLRKWVAFIVHSRHFDNIVLIFIFITSVTLLLERPDDTIIADACPKPPAFLDCSGLGPGQTEQIACARDEKEPDFDRVWSACDSDGPKPPCCNIVKRVETFRNMDVVFTLFFLVEMILKIVSDGLVAHKHAYLRNPWNVLDAAIVAVSLFSSFGSGESLKSLKALRALRALRPLRVIKRNPGLKIAVVCLLSSIPAMFNVIIVVIVWFSMYAMLGVQLFKGSLYRCVDLDSQLYFGAAIFPTGTLYTPTLPLSGPDAVPTIIECVTAGGGGVAVWEDQEYTFNSYPRALLTLFEMSTTEGWMDVMAACVDAVSVGVTPLPNANPYWSVFCAIHIILGAFVLLNLIVGSVINNYNRIKAKNDGFAPFMTAEQNEWLEIKRLVFHLRPRQRMASPKNPFRAACYRLSVHPRFEYMVTTIILLNVVTMVITTHDMDPCVKAAIFWINVVFTSIFLVEAIIKLFGLGVRWYFLNWWNSFDFIIVLLSIATITLDVLGKEYDCKTEDRGSYVSISSLELNPIAIPYLCWFPILIRPVFPPLCRFKIPALQIFRAFRIARVFRLVRRLKGLRQMIETLLVSLGSLVNIGTLLLLMMVIFSVLGVTFFYNVNQDEDLYGRMGYWDNYVHLDNALWLLHRQTTGEAWNGIMYYCMESDVYRACDKRYGDYVNDGCGGFAISIIFHVMWQVFGTYVMMQLFTAVILENFHSVAQDDLSALPIEKLHEFVDAWTVLDPEAEGSIGIRQLPDLIAQLSPPLGLKDKNVTSQNMMQIMKDLQIPIKEDRVWYNPTFLAFVKRVIATNETENGEDDFDVMSENEESAEENTVGATAAMEYAARRVQSAFREWKERRLQVKKAINVTFEIPINATAKNLVTC